MPRPSNHDQRPVLRSTEEDPIATDTPAPGGTHGCNPGYGSAPYGIVHGGPIKQAGRICALDRANLLNDGISAIS
jgi:hypothetical protein